MPGQSDRLAGELRRATLSQLEALEGEMSENCVGVWDRATCQSVTPPLEHVPPARSTAYRRNCPTMRERSDIFVGFIMMGLHVLRAAP